MKRIIYSFYIDIPKDELDIFDKNILIPNKSVPINYVTKDAFKENYTKLVACKKWYAKQLGVDFKMFEYDIDFILYKENMQRKHHQPLILMLYYQLSLVLLLLLPHL